MLRSIAVLEELRDPRPEEDPADVDASDSGPGLGTMYLSKNVLFCFLEPSLPVGGLLLLSNWLLLNLLFLVALGSLGL